MITATKFNKPKIERLSFKDWQKGTVTAYDDGRTPTDGLRNSLNVVLDQDGTLKPRPSLSPYGEQPVGTVLGEVFEFVRTTTSSSENWEICMQAVSTNEVQTISVTGSPTGGTFTLTYSGQTTAGIAYNASAATVQSALEALSNLAVGDVVCAGGALPTTAVTVTFQGALANTNVALLTADSTGLTGGTSPTVSIAGTTPGGLSGIPHVRKDGGAWTAVAGKYYDSTAPTHYIQIDDKVLVMNGEDNLSYFDIPTVITTPTVVPFVALSTPSAPTAVKSGLAGTTYTIYYRITANSTVGETVASVAGSVTVGAVREVWNPATDYVTLTWPAVSGAVSYNVYMGTVAGSEFMVSAGVNGLSFKDDGSLAQDLTRLAPVSDSTAGPKVSRGTVINGQVFLVGDKDQPRYVRFGGTGKFVLDFSPFNGGGYVEIGKGSKEFPVRVMPFRDGKGNAQITVLCRGTNGRGKRYLMSPNSTTIGETVISFFDVIEDNGQDGTESPDGVILYDDSLWYPSRDGFKTTGTKPQLQNLLSTDRVSNTIQTDIKNLNNSAMQKCVGLGFEGQLYWALPSGSMENNEIWVLDLDREGAWMKPWDIAADWLWLYNDNNGTTHFCVLSENKIYEFTTSLLTSDNGQAFPTSASSGLLKFSEDGMEWAKIIDITAFLQRPEGQITFSVAGKTEDEDLAPLGSEVYSSSASLVGWSEHQWSTAMWSQSTVPDSYSPANEPIVIEVDEEVQWFTWELGSTTAGVNYQLSDIIARFVRIGTKDLT